jgi:hypothetical protein
MVEIMDDDGIRTGSNPEKIPTRGIQEQYADQITHKMPEEAVAIIHEFIRFHADN